MSQCASCFFWAGDEQAYRARCALGNAYHAPAFNEGCAQHRPRSPQPATQLRTPAIEAQLARQLDGITGAQASMRHRLDLAALGRDDLQLWLDTEQASMRQRIERRLVERRLAERMPPWAPGAAQQAQAEQQQAEQVEAQAQAEPAGQPALGAEEMAAFTKLLQRAAEQINGALLPVFARLVEQAQAAEAAIEAAYTEAGAIYGPGPAGVRQWLEEVAAAERHRAAAASIEARHAALRRWRQRCAADNENCH